MSLLLSGKMPPQFGWGSSRCCGPAQGQAPAPHSRPLCPGALRTPSTGQTLPSLYLAKTDEAWVQVGEGPGKLPAPGWSRRDQGTTLGALLRLLLARGLDGARGSKWEADGHPAFHRKMASEFLLDVLSLCFLPQHQTLTLDLLLLGC